MTEIPEATLRECAASFNNPTVRQMAAELLALRSPVEPTPSLQKGEGDGWLDISTNPPPDLERVFVAGWQKPSGRTAGYWWVHEDMTNERGRPIDHPDALKWQFLPARPSTPPEPSP
jgi:hypothetical protein